MANFRAADRATTYLLLLSMGNWLTKNYLARFVADIVDQLDVSALHVPVSWQRLRVFRKRFIKKIETPFVLGCASHAG